MPISYIIRLKLNLKWKQKTENEILSANWSKVYCNKLHPLILKRSIQKSNKTIFLISVLCLYIKVFTTKLLQHIGGKARNVINNGKNLPLFRLPTRGQY